VLGQQFYNETIRKVVIAFGTMFNDIHLVRKDNNGTIIQTMKVPLAYGPRQKFLVRLREDADLTKQVAVTLPRIGFEITGLSYDPARKLNRVQKFRKVKGGNNKQLDTQYMPVPYNVDFELYVLSKQSDDALQIVEQILPYFQPDYTVTIKDNIEMDTKRDVPVILNSVTYEDDYEGDFTSRRSIITFMGLLLPPRLSKRYRLINIQTCQTNLRSGSRDIQLHQTHQLLKLGMILDLMKRFPSSKMLRYITQKQVKM